MQDEQVRSITGGLAVDDRGSLTFCNDFDFKGVKRFYLVKNHRQGFVRAWHGHKREGKFVTMTSGAIVLGAVQVDSWESPSPKLPVQRFILSAERPQVIYIPPGYANGFMTLTPDAAVMFFSTSTLDESKGDDFRFPARLWDIWNVEER